MDKTWTDADAKLLKQLRTATGQDRANFARRCTISTGQLTELEEGGSGRFYSESIKNHTGRTLLAKLGHVRRVIEADRMAALQAALDALPERQRQAVVLRHMEGFTNPEIAAVMDIGVEAVESLTARGKRALAALLAGQRGELGYEDDGD